MVVVCSWRGDPPDDVQRGMRRADRASSRAEAAAAASPGLRAMRHQHDGPEEAGVGLCRTLRRSLPNRLGLSRVHSTEVCQHCHIKFRPVCGTRCRTRARDDRQDGTGQGEAESITVAVADGITEPFAPGRYKRPAAGDHR
jgi:hypothetical protein